MCRPPEERLPSRDLSADPSGVPRLRLPRVRERGRQEVGTTRTPRILNPANGKPKEGAVFDSMKPSRAPRLWSPALDQPGHGASEALHPLPRSLTRWSVSGRVAAPGRGVPRWSSCKRAAVPPFGSGRPPPVVRGDRFAGARGRAPSVRSPVRREGTCWRESSSSSKPDMTAIDCAAWCRSTAARRGSGATSA